MYKKIFLIFCCLFFLVSCQKQPSTSLDTQKSTQDNQPSINSPSDQIQPLPTQTTSHPYEVTILMYHYIRDYTDSSDPIGVNLSVSPNTFDQQMKWLKDHNYQSFGINELDKIAQADPNVKPVIITFDDGYQDAYQNAFPILKKYGFKGVFYIIAGSVGDSAYMTWDQIKE